MSDYHFVDLADYTSDMKGVDGVIIRPVMKKHPVSTIIPFNRSITNALSHRLSFGKQRQTAEKSFKEGIMQTGLLSYIGFRVEKYEHMMRFPDLVHIRPIESYLTGSNFVPDLKKVFGEIKQIRQHGSRFSSQTHVPYYMDENGHRLLQSHFILPDRVTNNALQAVSMDSGTATELEIDPETCNTVLFDVDGKVACYHEPYVNSVNRKVNGHTVNPTMDFVLGDNPTMRSNSIVSGDNRKITTVCEVKIDLNVGFNPFKQVDLYRRAFGLMRDNDINSDKIQTSLLGREYSLDVLAVVNPTNQLMLVQDLYTLYRSLEADIRRLDFILRKTTAFTRGERIEALLDSTSFNAIGGKNVFNLFDGRAYFQGKHGALDEVLHSLPRAKARPISIPEYIAALEASAQQAGSDVPLALFESNNVFREFMYQAKLHELSKDDVAAMRPTEREFRDLCDGSSNLTKDLEDFFKPRLQKHIDTNEVS